MSKFHVMITDPKHFCRVTANLHGYTNFKKAMERALKEGTADIVRDNQFIAIVEKGKVIYKKETCGAF